MSQIYVLPMPVFEKKMYDMILEMRKRIFMQYQNIDLIFTKRNSFQMLYRNGMNCLML